MIAKICRRINRTWTVFGKPKASSSWGKITPSIDLSSSFLQIRALRMFGSVKRTLGVCSCSPLICVNVSTLYVHTRNSELVRYVRPTKLQFSCLRTIDIFLLIIWPSIHPKIKYFRGKWSFDFVHNLEVSLLEWIRFY